MVTVTLGTVSDTQGQCLALLGPLLALWGPCQALWGPCLALLGPYLALPGQCLVLWRQAGLGSGMFSDTLLHKPNCNRVVLAQLATQRKPQCPIEGVRDLMACPEGRNPTTAVGIKHGPFESECPCPSGQNKSSNMCPPRVLPCCPACCVSFHSFGAR